MKASEKDFTKCHEMAKKLAEGDGFNRELFDELADYAYKTGIDVSTDYETYVAVEDEVFYFVF